MFSLKIMTLMTSQEKYNGKVLSCHNKSFIRSL